MRALALIAVLAAAIPAYAGPCAMPPLEQEVATPAGTTIDQHGGVVVATVAGFAMSRGSTIVHDGKHRFRAGKREAPATPTTLAPGLEVYAVPSALHGEHAALALVDEKGTAIATVAMTPRKDKPALRAPQVKEVTAAPSNPRTSSAWVTATLKQAPPAGTIAVIVRDAKIKDAAARSFHRIDDPAAKEIVVYQGDRCTTKAPGTQATEGGHQIQLAWVSAAGHVSPWSTPMRVARSRMPARP